MWRETTYNTSAEPILTIQLGQTVYSGTLDLTSGILTVNMAIADLGALNWSQNGNFENSFEIVANNLNDKKVGVRNFICNLLSYAPFADTETYSIRGYNSSKNITIHLPLSVASSVNDAVQWITDNGALLCYELAQPITVQLTPEQLTTILGDNNIWADSGNVAVSYVADTKLYIDAAIAASAGTTDNSNRETVNDTVKEIENPVIIEEKEVKEDDNIEEKEI